MPVSSESSCDTTYCLAITTCLFRFNLQFLHVTLLQEDSKRTVDVRARPHAANQPCGNSFFIWTTLVIFIGPTFPIGQEKSSRRKRVRQDNRSDGILLKAFIRFYSVILSKMTFPPNYFISFKKVIRLSYAYGFNRKASAPAARKSALLSSELTPIMIAAGNRKRRCFVTSTPFMFGMR